LLNEEGGAEMCRKLAFVCVVLALSVPAYALTMTPTWGFAPTAWQVYGKQLQTTNLPPSVGDTAYVAEDNWGPGTKFQIAQTFAPTADFTLGALALTVGNGTAGGAGDITFELYDVGSDDGAWATPATIDFTATTSTKLWSQTIAYGGGAAEKVLALNFYGSGLIDLYAGESYALVITETVANQMAWYRSGASAYNGGQMYRGTSTPDTVAQVASWGSRQAGLAAYEIPEPATMALLGLGGLALLRRKKI
jgi:hypothetical protein